MKIAKKASGVPKPPERVFRRQGGVSKVETEFVAQFMRDQPADLTRGQISGLSKTLRRSPDAVKKIVDAARQQFAANAELYVDTHAKAVKGAMAKGDYETAAKASQWAMEKTSLEGHRVIEKEVEASNVPRVMIGIKIGGIDTDKLQQGALTATTVVDGETRE